MWPPPPNVERERVFPLAKRVSAALDGAVFPLARWELVAVARENDAPRLLLTQLEGLPDREYRTLEEVQEAVEGYPG